MRAVARALWAAARQFKVEHGSDTVFRPAIFRKLVATGAELSELGVEAGP